MPEYSYTRDDGRVVFIDSSAGIATVNGVTYHKPCTLEAENGELVKKPIPLELFQTIDFSRIEKVHIFLGGEHLGISPITWTHVVMEKLVVSSSTSTVGGKRCHF